MIAYLNEREIYIAKLLARWRMNDSQTAGYQPAAGAVRALSLDTLGAMGEMGVAKALNVWPGFTVGTFKLPDVAGLQVRATTHKRGRLLIRPNDADADVFVLVTVALRQAQGANQAVTLRGWCTGAEARTSLGEWIRPEEDRPLCWVVEQDRLHDVRLLVMR